MEEISISKVSSRMVSLVPGSFLPGDSDEFPLSDLFFTTQYPI